ncbi:acyl carrier protein [Croceibacterium aestuarii]|uniref:acyl carrier protein n=1 Tax=Croceibacterium aestuarii TaxID=3064139 RepID=UPI00272E2832|nr:acyl carrier protein [Croceibacterium sp. D39]
MPDTITIAERVRKIIAEHLGVALERTTNDAELIDDLGADSLDVIEIAIRIDDELGTDTEDDDYSKWRTVGDVVQVIERKR